MDTSWKKVIDYVSHSNHYSNLFNQLHIEINEANIKRLLTEFMTALVTPNSRFDQYLSGDKEALSPIEKRGWEAFQSNGCVTCHRGTNIGGGMVMRFGYFGENTMGEARSSDKGRFETTAKQEDEYLFRVASLRNVALTAPYFHEVRPKASKKQSRSWGKANLGEIYPIRPLMTSTPS